MTTARSMQIDLQVTPFYHCMSRCVRRSFLCGFDKETNKDYTHRKRWLLNRIKFLSKIFSIQICNYGIMDNHYHLILHVDNQSPNTWSNDEVITRWAQLYPQNAKQNKHNPMKILDWRKQLQDISLFMKNINEPLAKMANKEDDVRGRFWEGRFKCQALLDEGALLSAMVYVDLNPIRAGIAETPEDSKFTSIYERIKFAKKQLQQSKTKNKIKPKRKNYNKTEVLDSLKQPSSLMPFLDIYNQDIELKINFKLSDYLELVDCSGRIIREGKRGAIPNHLTPILRRLNFNNQGWFCMVSNLSQYFYNAIGSVKSLRSFSTHRKRTVKGINSAKFIYASA